MLEVKIFTLYPDLFPGPLDIGIFKKAKENKIWNLKVINIRDYSKDNHGTVDDAPFGGVGDSGTGSYHGYEGFINFSHSKTVFSQTPYEFPLKITRPPYGAGIRRFLDIMIRK